MNEQQENLDRIKKNVEYLGFGTRLHELIDAAAGKDLPQFGIGSHYPMTRSDGKGIDNMYYRLNFNKNEAGEYRFSSFDAKLQKANESREYLQQFSAESREKMTRTQAYKLLSGMALEKDVYIFPKGVEGSDTKPEKRSVWFKLELDVTDSNGQHPLKSFYPEYGFDLKATLQKYPLRDIGKTEKQEELMAKIRNGIPAESIIKVDNRYLPVYLTAHPMMKSITVFNEEGLEIRQSDIFPALKQSEKQGIDQEQSEKSDLSLNTNKNQKQQVQDNSIGR